jgi:hypothetical protein
MARLLERGLFLLAAVLAAIPADAAGPSIRVTPQTLNFGVAPVGQTRTLYVAIANVGSQTLTVSAVALESGGSPAFTLPVAPTVPFDLAPRRSKLVKVAFLPTDESTPAATLDVASNDPATPVAKVTLKGTGRTPNQLGIGTLLTFFDAATSQSQPTLAGQGGNWPWLATWRLYWMRSLLVAAQQCDSQAQTEIAWVLLYMAYLRCDGQPWPPDLVEGTAALQLAGMIWTTLDAYLTKVKPPPATTAAPVN